jgi:hypothetical protein
MSLGLFPCNQPECQKLALLSSPKDMCVQFAKRSLSMSSQGTSVPTHALFGEV